MDNLVEIRWHGRGGQGAKTRKFDSLKNLN